jgi:hypothetical protein
MAGDADGYGDFGGGGSVHWELKVGEGLRPVPQPKDPNDAKSNDKHAYTVKGVDTYLKKEGGDPGYFEVTLVQGAPGSVLVTTEGNLVKLYLKVNGKEDANPQVKVRWGAVVAPPRAGAAVPISAVLGSPPRPALD